MRVNSIPRTRTCNPLIKSQNPVEDSQGVTSSAHQIAHQTDANHPPANPDLHAIVEAWPDLPDAVKAGIVAMVKAANR